MCKIYARPLAKPDRWWVTYQLPLGSWAAVSQNPLQTAVVFAPEHQHHSREVQSTPAALPTPRQTDQAANVTHTPIQTQESLHSPSGKKDAVEGPLAPCMAKAEQ